MTMIVFYLCLKISEFQVAGLFLSRRDHKVEDNSRCPCQNHLVGHAYNKHTCVQTHTHARPPPGAGCRRGCGNGVTPAAAGDGDKRCCFKLWRPSFLGAAVYPPLKYNGGLWRPGRPGQRLPSVCCSERRRKAAPPLANDTFCFHLP